MDIAELRSRVLSKHAGSPQRHGLAELYLTELERALTGLAGIGENIQLETGGTVAAVQFPKMLYHAKELQPRVVHSSDEEKEARASGWNEFPGGLAPARVRSIPGVTNPAPTPRAPPTTRVAVQTKGGD